jgi:methionine-S-sulfoxide reductase
VRTEVGYAGGKAAHPTYANIQDHSEAIRITYDPSVLTYTDLLKLFWDGNHPFRQSYARQYRSAILWQDESQRKLAQETMPKGKVYTAIEPLGVFTLAEDYHQKYYLRNTPQLFQEYKAMYPDERDFVGSTSAARANGYLGGYSSTRADLPRMGLSQKARKVLENVKPRLGCGG